MTKTVPLSDDAYKSLEEIRRPGESLADVIHRLVGKRPHRRPIRDSAGTWPMTQEEADRLTMEIYSQR